MFRRNSQVQLAPSEPAAPTRWRKLRRPMSVISPKTYEPPALVPDSRRASINLGPAISPEPVRRGHSKRSSITSFINLVTPHNMSMPQSLKQRRSSSSVASAKPGPHSIAQAMPQAMPQAIPQAKPLPAKPMAAAKPLPQLPLSPALRPSTIFQAPDDDVLDDYYFSGPGDSDPQDPAIAPAGALAGAGAEPEYSDYTYDHILYQDPELGNDDVVLDINQSIGQWISKYNYDCVLVHSMPSPTLSEETLPSAASTSPFPITPRPSSQSLKKPVGGVVWVGADGV